MGYKPAMTPLEALIPFVKTPINPDLGFTRAWYMAFEKRLKTRSARR
jgi:hypothetical protein